MARRFDLTGAKDKIQRRNAQRDTYGNQTPLSSTAVERGETHWMDGSYVRIDGLLDVNGTATVGGTLSVTGTLNASGSINLSGSTGITGPLNVTGTTTIGGNTSITGELVVTGPTTLDGDTEVGGTIDVTGAMSTKGTLSVEGVTTLKNDLNVDAGGKIKAGNVEVDPTGGGTIRTLNATISDNGATLQILSPTGLQLNGISTNIASPDIFMPSISVKLGAEPNLHIDENKKIWICG